MLELVQRGAIIGVLQEQETGATAAHVCRCHVVSEQIFYRWKRRDGGVEVSEAGRRKWLIVKQALDNHLLAQGRGAGSVRATASNQRWSRELVSDALR